MDTTEITYRKEGKYLIPNIVIENNTQVERIGKFGKMRKEYLKNHRQVNYLQLQLEEELWEHLVEVDTLAEEMMEKIVEQMKQVQGVTEELKAKDQMKWVQMMNNILQQAQEIVMAEIIHI